MPITPDAPEYRSSESEYVRLRTRSRMWISIITALTDKIHAGSFQEVYRKEDKMH